jgi:N6-adenosine-specific RNA methylase IME4
MRQLEPPPVSPLRPGGLIPLPRLADRGPVPPFGTLVADNPWRWHAWGPGGHRKTPRYPKMELADLYALPVAALAAPDCVLHLWVIDTLLPQAMLCGLEWGFAYKKIGYVWGKVSQAGVPAMSTGYLTRNAAEVCLTFTRGQPQRQSRGECQLILRERGANSQKPEAFQDSMERLFPGPYVELFARRRRPGWTGLGNELDGLDIRVSLAQLNRRVARYRALVGSGQAKEGPHSQRIYMAAGEAKTGARADR